MHCYYLSEAVQTGLFLSPGEAPVTGYVRGLDHVERHYPVPEQSPVREACAAHPHLRAERAGRRPGAQDAEPDQYPFSSPLR
jgi:hypothetical protein